MFETSRDALTTRYNLRLQTLSPLHIGSGEHDLERSTLDFVTLDGQVVVLDPDKVAQGLSEAQLNRLYAGVPLAEIVEALRPDQLAEMAAYTLSPPPDPLNRIRPHIKIMGNPPRPYLPGSSLKGALRTALAWVMLREGVVKPGQRDLGPYRYFADNTLERLIFGTDPNHDLLRALHIADTQGVNPDQLTLSQVTVYSLQRSGKLVSKGPRFRFHLETLPAGTILEGSVRRDNYLLSPDIARRLKFDTRRDYLFNLMQHLKAHAQALIDEELAFFQHTGPQSVVDFYQHLAASLAKLPEKESCLLQIGWGTGWVSKTVADTLAPELLAEIRQRYQLGRREVATFPKTRRLIEDSSGPVAPLGWLLLTLSPEGQEINPPPIATAVTRPQIPRPPTSSKRRLLDLRIGEMLEGHITRTTNYGAFVNIGLPTEGLIHVSKLSDEWVSRVEEIVQPGDRVRVEVIRLEPERGRIGLRLIEKIG